MSEFSNPEFVTATETLDLRHRILRPGQDILLCHYFEDNLASTFHFGIRHELDESYPLISCGSFIQQKQELFPTAKNAYRLRGMATDISYQRKGLGQSILQKALVELRKRDGDLLWFNARLSAETFYNKQGFLADKKIFEINSIGSHKVMYKWL